MTTLLTNRAWYDLRSVAHAHGLPFHTKQSKAQVYHRLYRSLMDDGASNICIRRGRLCK